MLESELGLRGVLASVEFGCGVVFWVPEGCVELIATFVFGGVSTIWASRLIGVVSVTAGDIEAVIVVVLENLTAATAHNKKTAVTTKISVEVFSFSPFARLSGKLLSSRVMAL